MASLDPSSLPLVLDAMQRYGAMTRGLPPTATLAQLLLSKLESLYPLLGADEIVHCLYCLVKMRVRPNEEWMRSFDETMSMSIPGGNVRAMSLEWQEKPEAASLSGDGGDVIDRVSRPISGGGLGKLTWCYGRLRYQPSEITRDALVSRVQDLLKSQSEMIRRGDGSSNSYIGLTDLGLLLWSVRRSRMLLPSATYEAWKGACISMLRSEAKLEGSGREVLDLYLKGIEEGEELDGLHDHLSPPTPLPSSPPSPSPTRYPPAGVPERRQPATARSVLQASVARLHSPNDYFKGN